MEFEDKIKNKLRIRGFSEEQIINNRGLIGAVIDETILETVKSEKVVEEPFSLLDGMRRGIFFENFMSRHFSEDYQANKIKMFDYFYRAYGSVAFENCELNFRGFIRDCGVPESQADVWVAEYQAYKKAK